MLLAKGKIMVNLDKCYNYFDEVYEILKKTETTDHPPGDAFWSTGLGAHPTATISSSCTLGINSLSTGGSYELYPNPAGDEITLSLDQKASYAIYSITGSQLTGGNLIEGDNIIDISQLETGLYFVRITGDNGFNISAKIVKE